MKINSLLGFVLITSINSFGLNLTLYKGASLTEDLKYWSVEDTYIEAKLSEENFGRDIFFSAGPKKIIFIRFGDLTRAIGPYKIDQSELVLKGNFKTSQKLVGIWKILQSWEEGSGSTQFSYSTPLEKLWKKEPSKGGVNWNQRSAGHKWLTCGALHALDKTPIKGISLEVREGSAFIKGLNKFIQDSLENPQNNHGLALEFSEDVKISSSDAFISEERPKLVIKTSQEKILLNSKVRAFDSKRLTTKKVKLLVHTEIEKQFDSWVQSQGYIDKQAWFASSINTFNDELMEHSRFSFNPQGLTLRLIDSDKDFDFILEIDSLEEVNSTHKMMKTLLTKAIGLPVQQEADSSVKIEGKNIWRSSISPYEGILKRGDTRDERFLPNTLFLQSEPWYDSLLHTTFMPSTDLLSASETIELEKLIHAPLENWKPGVVMVKVCNSWNQILPETEVILFKDGKNIGVVKTDQRGYFILPKEINNDLKPTESLYLKIRSQENEVWSLLKGASVLESYGRGNYHVAMISSRFLIPSVPLDHENLAKGKLISDSKKSYPAQMVSLTQENSVKESSFLNKKGEWIELDLGRDRPVGQIILEVKGIHLPKFEIRFYNTGQKNQESILWSRENGGDWSMQNLSKPVERKEHVKQLEYYGLPISTRYIRIISLENDKPLNLVNIKTYASLLKTEKNS